MAKKPTAQERKDALRDKTRQGAKDRNKGGNRGKPWIDFSKFDEVSFFKPNTKKKNLIDIVPYLVTSDVHPQGMRKGFEDYVLDVWVHRNIGSMDDSFICLKNTFGKPCPACEERARLKREGEDENQVSKASRRVVYNLIDLNDEEKGVQLFEASHWLFEKELLDEAESGEDEVVTFGDREDGFSVEFRASEVSRASASGEKFEFNEYKSFNFRKRKTAYGEEILEDTYPLDALMVAPTYEEIAASLFGEDEIPEIDGHGTKEKDEEKDVPHHGDDSAKEANEKAKELEDLEEELEDMDRRELRTYAREHDVDVKGIKDEDEIRGLILVASKEEGSSKEEGGTEEECPEGYVWGVDCDEKPECKNCEKWKACVEAQDEI